MPTLADVRGKYSDRCAVVLGAGPSLRHLKDRPLTQVKVGETTMCIPDVSMPSPIHKHIVIAVNDAILKVPDADFYFTSDPGMCQYNHWDLLCKALKSIVVVNTPPFTREDMKQSFGISGDRVILYEKRRVMHGLGMSVNDHKILYGPGSGHCAANFATILGCKRIYLLGFDSRCESGHKYFWQFRDQPHPGGTTTGHASHHLKSLARLGRKPKKSIYEDFDATTGEPSKPSYNGWLQISQLNKHLDIIDASGGALRDVFPSTTIEQMLEGKP
jgi:hypothetical protein